MKPGVEPATLSMMGEEEEDINRRRIVLHPRTAAARRVDRRRSYGSHVRGFTVQDSEVFELVARQRRRAIGYLIVILIPLFVLLLSFTWMPEITNKTVGGMPLPWLLVGPITLFSIILLAWRHDQHSLRVERDWSTEHQDPKR